MLVFVVLFSAYYPAYANSTNITAANLALIVNDRDLNSIAIADYYQDAHKVPNENIIHISLNNKSSKLSIVEFENFKLTLSTKLSDKHKAVLFVWSKPFQVNCQAITAVFTNGYDSQICAKTCNPSRPSTYFNLRPHNNKKVNSIRLSMLLPTHEIELAKQVINNGVLSKNGVFKSSAYYLKTSDKARNSRVKFFPKDGVSFKGKGLTVVNKSANALTDVDDVMVYQTGVANVKKLDSINFLPGALADHLTSFGGQLFSKSQMSVVEWLRAGATASYGTVSEPCNYWQKFPNPSVLLNWYVHGATAIEAYWRSVAWPAQGLFIGDPLAQPYAN